MIKKITLTLLIFTGILKSSSACSNSNLVTVPNTDVVVQKNNIFTELNPYSKRLTFIDSKENKTYGLAYSSPYSVIASDLESIMEYKGERILLLAIKQDVNNDTIIDWKAPTKLYICNIHGQNLQQISLDNYNVDGFKFVPNSNSIVIISSQDSNEDGKFTPRDKSTIFSFDFSTGKLTEVK